MQVLLLGATGKVGSRLLSALLAHNHRVILYLRNPDKLPAEQVKAIGGPSSIVQGNATDVDKIKQTILEHGCDALVNAAGYAGQWAKTSEFPAIFATIVKAASEATASRGDGKRLRCWFLAGWTLLDVPGLNGQKIVDFLPLFPDHRTNHELIKSLPPDTLNWSLFCASVLKPDPKRELPPFTVSSDSPPLWLNRFGWIPLVGQYLNILTQVARYHSTYEQCADFIAADLEKGANSTEFSGKRVGYISRI